MLLGGSMKGIPAGLAVLMLAAVIQGCAQEGTAGARLADGGKLQITQEVWDKYQEYVRHGVELGPKRNGAFGVAIMGDVGVVGIPSYTYCPRTYDGCRPGGGTNAVSAVLDLCRRENVECIIFARNDTVSVPYEIVK